MNKKLKRIRLFLLLKLKEVGFVLAILGVMWGILYGLDRLWEIVLTNLKLADLLLNIFMGLIMLGAVVVVNIGIYWWLKYNWEKVKEMIP